MEERVKLGKQFVEAISHQFCSRMRELIFFVQEAKSVICHTWQTYKDLFKMGKGRGEGG